MIKDFPRHMMRLKEMIGSRVFYIVCALCFFVCSKLSVAVEISSSVWSGVGEGAHGDNGVMIVAFNKETNVLTGYYETSNTVGSGISECKVYFSGTGGGASVKVNVSDADKASFSTKAKSFNGSVVFNTDGRRRFAMFYPEKKSWSCEWVYDGLPSYVPPKNFNIKNGLQFDFVRDEDFVAVGVVKANRAYFHTDPDTSAIRKTFLVAGDFFYAFAENNDWYYVKFKGRKKPTVGWIKKSDTIQFDR